MYGAAKLIIIVNDVWELLHDKDEHCFLLIKMLLSRLRQYYAMRRRNEIVRFWSVRRAVNSEIALIPKLC